MVRHTMKSLGPKVLASRMVADYVERLYVPASASARAVNSDYDGARELATWKHRVRDGWPGVRVEHVESTGVADTPEVHSTLSVRAFVSLGALSPEDVDVQLVHGTVKHEDDLVDTSVASLAPTESYDDGRHRYEGSVSLDRTGPFGYTVRILPKHSLLASPAELGVVALP